MPTPTYVGAGQPPADNGGGFFGRFGSFFGSTPAYVPAPPKVSSESDPDVIAADSPLVTCPIDPEALASGRIAIVVPRGM